MGSKRYLHFLPPKCVHLFDALRHANLTNSIGRKYKNHFLMLSLFTLFGAQNGAQNHHNVLPGTPKVTKSDGLLVKIDYRIKLAKNMQK